MSINSMQSNDGAREWARNQRKVEKAQEQVRRTLSQMAMADFTSRVDSDRAFQVAMELDKNSDYLMASDDGSYESLNLTGLQINSELDKQVCFFSLDVHQVRKLIDTLNLWVLSRQQENAADADLYDATQKTQELATSILRNAINEEALGLVADFLDTFNIVLSAEQEESLADSCRRMFAEKGATPEVRYQIWDHLEKAVRTPAFIKRAF